MTAPTKDYWRREFLMSEGEPLLLSGGVLDLSERTEAFSAATGIPVGRLLSTPVCALPLPLYNADANGDSRPVGLRPEALWHPLFWLPGRLKGRYLIEDPDTGESRIEDEITWAIRNALELTISGLYDPTTGAWVDVLSTVGIDIEDEIDLARVTEWLAGTPDDDLDSIDLSEAMSISPENWALEAALSLHDDVRRAAAHRVATELAAVLDEDPEESLKAITTLAAGRLRGLLDDDEMPEFWENADLTATDAIDYLHQIARDCEPSLALLLEGAE